MKLGVLDWSIMAAYFAFVLAVGLFFRRRAGTSIQEFFVSGRSLPWWLAGTSMIATTFSADMPLTICGMVAKQGVAANWLYWQTIISGMLTTFLLSHLWRRAEVVTDAELTELRYSGRSAAFLRGLKAVYFGILFNCFVLAWVMKGMTKLCDAAFGWDQSLSLTVLVFFVMFYTLLSGLWGVVVTDLVQFVIAMTGSLLLSVFAWRHVGGLAGLQERLAELAGPDNHYLSLTPSSGDGVGLPWESFFVYIGVLWWASREADSGGQGGGYVVQRMSACRDPKHALYATLWFNIANHGLRTWPWIVTALVAYVTFPNLEDPEMGYPLLMVKLLPTGFLGLMVTSLLAAFMSTIDTHLNWGASYLVTDLYQRFIRREAPDAHYVMISRLSILGLLIVSVLMATQIESLQTALEFVSAFGAGSGLVLLLRWFWWRINAWSEISAFVTSSIVSTGLYLLRARSELPDGSHPLQLPSIGLIELEFRTILPTTVIVTCAVWLTVTFLTAPVDRDVLIRFCRRVSPGGWGWRVFTREVSDLPRTPSLMPWLVGWLLGMVFVYSFMLGTGNLIFGHGRTGSLLLGLSFFASLGIVRVLRNLNAITAATEESAMSARESS